MHNEIDVIEMSPLPTSVMKRQLKYSPLDLDDSSPASSRKNIWVATVILVLLVGTIATLTALHSSGSHDRNSNEVNSDEPLIQQQTLMSCSTGDISLSSRKFEFYAPDGTSEESPIIFVWHGLSATPAKIEAKIQMKAQADTEKWVVVYPYGTGFIKSFNGMGCCQEGPDDVQFAKDIIDHLETNNCGDVNKVFSTGFSNGGFMTHRLGCEAGLRSDGSTWFKALAPHSGLIGEYASTALPDIGDYDGCNVAEDVLVPIISFHGTADPVVGYDGQNSNPFSNAQWYSFSDTMSHWRTLHGCDASLDVVDSNGECTSNPSCDVVMCSLDGLVHDWSSIATAEVVTFFKQFM